jgi:hypothetical protein
MGKIRRAGMNDLRTPRCHARESGRWQCGMQVASQRSTRRELHQFDRVEVLHAAADALGGVPAP